MATTAHVHATSPHFISFFCFPRNECNCSDAELGVVGERDTAKMILHVGDFGRIPKIRIVVEVDLLTSSSPHLSAQAYDFDSEGGVIGDIVGDTVLFIS